MVDTTQQVPESLESLYTGLKSATNKQQHASIVDIVNKITP
jgi:hypothetical protein